MLRLFLIGHTYKYECEKLCQIFFPLEKQRFAEEGEPFVPDEAETRVRISLLREPNAVRGVCEAYAPGADRLFREEEPLGGASTEEECLARVAVRALSAMTGFDPPWGVLTGVRPAKLMRALIEERGESAAEAVFRGEYMVQPGKTRLALEVAKAERALLSAWTPADCSVYVSIPFCPTRCSYCSFVSHSVQQARKLIPDYVELLCGEIAHTGRVARELGLRVMSVYIGGGTPTTLSAEQLAAVCGALNESFGAADCPEFTVEAGRPDTVTPEKLAALKQAGVTRVSINPQTFSDAVLEGVGRRHTAAETIEKYELARRAGFGDINMDLIAGLPGDTPEGFADSLSKAIGLGPENITVHTLALKRAAGIVTGGEAGRTAGDTAAMLRFASSALPAAGYGPYYMYRQSRSVGNLENVGWTKPGYACLYNVYMMEEVHTVLSCGGGGVTKLVDPPTNRLVRVFNFKYPYEYVRRFGELSERKNGILRFYGSEAAVQ